MFERNPFYFLGTIEDGRIYGYTRLGEFKTAEAAAARCLEFGAIVFEQFHVYAACSVLPFGLSAPKPVATCLGTPGSRAMRKFGRS